MNDYIIYSTTTKQIEKLTSKNLIITNEHEAIRVLQRYGYSNVIKSYRDPYVIMENDEKLYRDGVSFEQVYSLYTLDKHLRNSVMSAMLDLEEHLKAVAADVLAETFGVHQDDYLQFKNYRDKSRKNTPERFTLGGILSTLRKTLDTNKNPICHYKTVHQIVPPWILFKSVYLSTIINFINHFKTSEKNKMVAQLYSDFRNEFNDQQMRSLMMDTLFLCLEYRNLAAHGGRIYNHESKKHLSLYSAVHEDAAHLFGFSKLLVLLRFFEYDHPYRILQTALNQEVNRHCTQFPEDVTYLGQVLNINIEKHSIVYVSPKSKKFHADPHCSGLHGAKALEQQQALDKNYTACKKCVPIDNSL